MALLSKFKFVTTTSTCQQYLHPYTDSCSANALILPACATPGSLKTYAFLYVLALLMRGKIPNQKDLISTFLRILQSTSFLTCNAFSYSLFLCLLRKVMGNFNMLTASFVPAFMASFCAILLERPSRRGMLSLYVTNVASETLFRMAAWRGWVKPIPHGEVAIFTLAITGLLYFYRGKHCSRDSIYGLMRFAVGPFEEGGYTENREDPPVQFKTISPKKPKMSLKLIYHICKLYNYLILKLKNFRRHQQCPHPFSCTYYVLQGTVKLFSVGYGLQISLRFLLQLRRIVRQPKLLRKVLFHKNALYFGAFLGGFSGVFRMISCILRWTTGEDTQYHAIPAGLFAGLTFALFPDNSIALYIMWKVLQIVYSNCIEKGFVPELPGATILLYCFSTATLFHAALLEPQNLRPSYWNFLYRISGGTIAAMDRKYLDVFGLESSKSLAQVLEATGTKNIPTVHF